MLQARFVEEIAFKSLQRAVLAGLIKNRFSLSGLPRQPLVALPNC
jgi:hypothetical protein